jgi:hypothetical protein
MITLLLESASGQPQDVPRTLLAPTRIFPGEVITVQVLVPGHTVSGGSFGFDGVILLDESGSMESNDQNLERRTAAKQLVADYAGTNPLRQFGVVAFSDIAEDAVGGLSTDVTHIREAIDELPSPSPGTNIVSGMSLANEILESSPTDGNRFVLFLSDGNPEDETGPTSEDAVLAMALDAARLGIRYYCAGLGAANMRLLSAIANLTGGRAIYLERPEDIYEVFGGALSEIATVAVARVKVDLSIHPSMRMISNTASVPAGDARISYESENQLICDLGRISSQEWKEIKFQVTSIDPAADYPGESLLIPLFGNTRDATYQYPDGVRPPVQIDNPTVTSLRPGSPVITKEYDSSRSTLTLRLRNTWPAGTHSYLYLTLTESPSGWFSVDTSNMMVTGPVSESKFYPGKKNDVLVFTIRQLLPQSEWKAEIKLDVRSDRNDPTSLSLNKVSKEEFVEPNLTFRFDTLKSTQQKVLLPVILTNVRVQPSDGRPDLHIDPPERYLEGSPNEGYPSYAPPAALNSDDIWIDGPRNGRRTSILTPSAAQIVARTSNAKLPAGGTYADIQVVGQGDPFEVASTNWVYCRFSNVGKYNTNVAGKELRLRLFVKRKDSPDLSIGNVKVMLPSLSPGQSFVAAGKIRPHMINPLLLSDYGSTKKRILELLSTASSPLAAELEAWFRAHRDGPNGIRDTDRFLPDKLLDRLDGELKLRLAQLLRLNQVLAKKWRNPCFVLAVRIEGLESDEAHRSNNTSMELISTVGW